MKRYDLFLHGEPTEYYGEWRHVGNFEAPSKADAIKVAKHFMESRGEKRVAVFTGNVKSTIGRLVWDSSEEDMLNAAREAVR